MIPVADAIQLLPQARTQLSKPQPLPAFGRGGGGDIGVGGE